MPEKLSTRVEQIEALMVMLAEKQDQFAGQLAESQLKTDAQFRETERHMQETDRRLRELGEKTDERIGKLVSAIAELVRRNGAK